ncbi:MAG: flavodoxin [Eubacteriales bacterium]
MKKTFRKLLCFITAFLILLSTSACNNNINSDLPPTDHTSDVTDKPSEIPNAPSDATEKPSETTEKPSETTKPSIETPNIPSGSKILVAYFSWSSSGNTERMAEYIAEKTGGDLYEIEPEIPYPTDYTKCTEVALEERDNNARPAIKNLIDLSQYDVIFIGYPIWWHTAPMIIGTFLESNHLTDKDIYPFSQSASMNGAQFASSMEFVRACSDGATVHDGLFTSPNNTAQIDAYLKGIVLISASESN